MKTVYLFLIAFCLTSFGCKRENGYHNPYLDRMKKLADEARANPSNKTALEKLKAHTTDSDNWDQYYAFSFLGELAKENVGNYREELLPYFDKMLKNSDQSIRRMGVEKLLDMPAEIDKFLPTLLNIVQQGKEDDVTWFSTEALGKLENPKLIDEALPVLLKALKTPPPEGTPDEAPQVRYDALDSIKELAQKTKIDVVPELQKISQASKSPFKERVAETILELNPVLKQK